LDHAPAGFAAAASGRAEACKPCLQSDEEHKKNNMGVGKSESGIRKSGS